jgi:hypothetical protein
MGKKPRQWSPDGLKYLMIINPFGWRNPPDGSSRNVTPRAFNSMVKSCTRTPRRRFSGSGACLASQGSPHMNASEAIVYTHTDRDQRGDLNRYRRIVWILRVFWESTGGRNSVTLTRPDSSYIFETKYESLAHACGADSWKRGVRSSLGPSFRS